MNGKRKSTFIKSQGILVDIDVGWALSQISSIYIYIYFYKIVCILQLSISFSVHANVFLLIQTQYIESVKMIRWKLPIFLFGLIKCVSRPSQPFSCIQDCVLQDCVSKNNIVPFCVQIVSFLTYSPNAQYSQRAAIF